MEAGKTVDRAGQARHRGARSMSFGGRRGLALILLALGVPAAAAGLKGGLTLSGPFSWSQSFSLVGTSYYGTEGRQFVTINPYTSSAALLWADGTSGSVGHVGATTVFILNKPENRGGSWAVDTTFSASCAAEGHANCFQTVDTMQNIVFTKDSAGDTVYAVIPAAGLKYDEGTSNSCSSGSSPLYSAQRNNTDGAWYGTMVACGAGTDVNIRSFSWNEHIDTVTGAGYAFLGSEPNGIFRGRLIINWAFAGVNPISWSSSPEWDQSLYTGPTGSNCSLPRVMGFAELTGLDGVTRAYASVCDQILVRIDGWRGTCSSIEQVLINGNCVYRWQPYWVAQSTPRSDNGMRGLTALQPEYALITGYEGRANSRSSSDIHIWNVPAFCPSANTGCPTSGTTGAGYSCADYNSSTGLVSLSNPNCGTSEFSMNSTSPTMVTLTGITPGNSNVMPFDRFVPFYNSFGVLQYYVPFTLALSGPATPPQLNWSYMVKGGKTQNEWAEATHLIRTSPGNYTLVVEPDLFTQPQNGERDVAISPWSSECTWDAAIRQYINCAIYVTGWNVDTRTNSAYWCLPDGTPCPVSPTTTVANQSAWVARYGPRAPARD